MKKLFSYLDRIGADYRPQKMGQDYFYNTPCPSVMSAFVCFEYSDESSARETGKLINRIKNYCKRYNYTITGGWSHFGGVFTYSFRIMKSADITRLENYMRFVKWSADDCTEYIHKARKTGASDKDINTALRGIMRGYENAYKDFLAATA